MVDEVTVTHIVSLITALMLGSIQLFLETASVARQHIVAGMSLITYTAHLRGRTCFTVRVRSVCVWWSLMLDNVRQ